MVKIKWIPNDDPKYECYHAYVEGERGAYKLFYQVNHPDYKQNQYRLLAERAKDNTSSGNWGDIVMDNLVQTSKHGEAKRAEAESDFMQCFVGGIDYIKRDITREEYLRWNELHPGRDGYRVDDWVIYARKKGSKGPFMPFSPYDHTLPKAQTQYALRALPHEEDKVLTWLNGQADDPKWEFEARTGKEGPSEKRIRATTPSKVHVKSVKSTKSPRSKKECASTHAKKNQGGRR